MICYTKVLETHLTICVPWMDETKVGKGVFTKDHFITRACDELGHELVMSWLRSNPSSLFNPLQYMTGNIKQRVWHWIGLIHSSIVQHQIPRDQSRSKLLNQRQAYSKWWASRPRALPCCCWKGRSPPTPDTICGRRDKKMPPEIEETSLSRSWNWIWQDNY